MHMIKWMALVVALVVATNVSVRTQASSSKPRAKPTKPAPAARTVEKPETIVDGYGETAEKARERALERAQERVEELLRERFDRLGWHLHPEQLDTDYLLRFNVIQPRGEPEPAPVKGGEKMLVARYRIELTPEYLHELVRVSQQDTVQQRHLLLSRLLVGILAVLLVTAGYLRLEELTRGYATKLLRLGVVVFLSLVGAGLYLTR